MSSIEKYEPSKNFRDMNEREIVEYIKHCNALDKKGGRRKTRKYIRNKNRNTRKVTKY